MVPSNGKPNPGQWAFVTTSPADRCPTAAQKTLVRRHIMRDIGRSRRKSHQLDSQEEVRSWYGSPCEDAVEKPVLSRTPQLRDTPLWSIDDDSRRVLRHMFSDGAPIHLQIYRDKWLPVCLDTPAALSQMMVCYTAHLYRWQRVPEPNLQNIMLKNHAKALALVRKRLGSPDQPLTEGYLIAIIMFACYAHINRDSKGWSMHMSAIRYVTASLSKACPQVISNVAQFYHVLDTTGSYAWGIPVSLDIPSLPSSPPVDQTPLGLPLIQLINLLHDRHRSPLTRAFQAIKFLDNRFTALCLDPLLSPTSRECLEIEAIVHSIARQFLLIPSPPEPSPEAAAFSCLQAGALLYVAEVRRRTGTSPLITTAQISKLRKSMDALGDHVALAPGMQIWFTIIGAMESTEEADQHHFLHHTKLLASKYGLETITQYQHALGEVIWCKGLFEQRLAALITQV